MTSSRSFSFVSYAIDLVLDDVGESKPRSMSTALQLTPVQCQGGKSVRSSSPIRGSDQHTNTQPEICYWQQGVNGGSSCQSCTDGRQYLRNVATRRIICNAIRRLEAITISLATMAAWPTQLVGTVILHPLRSKPKSAKSFAPTFRLSIPTSRPLAPIH